MDQKVKDNVAIMNKKTENFQSISTENGIKAVVVSARQNKVDTELSKE